MTKPFMHRYAFACAAALAATLLLELLWLSLFGHDQVLGVPVLWQRPIPAPHESAIDQFPLMLLLFAIIPALDQPRWRNAAAMGCVFGLAVQGGYLLAHMGHLEHVSADWLMADWAWGTLLATAATTAAWCVRHRMADHAVAYRPVSR